MDRPKKTFKKLFVNRGTIGGPVIIQNRIIYHSHNGMCIPPVVFV